MVKTQSFHCGVMGLVPGWGTRIRMPYGMVKKLKIFKKNRLPKPLVCG